VYEGGFTLGFTIPAARANLEVADNVACVGLRDSLLWL
jgi:hypothetical protein